MGDLLTHIDRSCGDSEFREAMRRLHDASIQGAESIGALRLTMQQIADTVPDDDRAAPTD